MPNAQLAPLLQAFSGGTVIVCADHGDCRGEDGLWEHGIHHEKVLEVPLLFRLAAGPAKRASRSAARPRLPSSRSSSSTSATIHAIPSAFITLTDGRILFAYSRYYGASLSDVATARPSPRARRPIEAAVGRNGTACWWPTRANAAP